MGAGPIGLSLSILLSKLGFKIDLFEKRTWLDFSNPPDDTKVLGTTFTCRGYDVIKRTGLLDAYGVQMHGTEIHLANNSYKYLNGKGGEIFSSLNRDKLLKDLFDLAVSSESTVCYWGTKIENVDAKRGEIQFEIEGIK